MSEAPASGRITAEIMPLTMIVLRCLDTAASETRSIAGGEFLIGRGAARRYLDRGRLCCMDQPVEAMTQGALGLMRCRHTLGIRVPASQSLPPLNAASADAARSIPHDAKADVVSL
jgi:hypothetical protein